MVATLARCWHGSVSPKSVIYDYTTVALAHCGYLHNENSDIACRDHTQLFSGIVMPLRRDWTLSLWLRPNEGVHVTSVVFAVMPPSEANVFPDCYT